MIYNEIYSCFFFFFSSRRRHTRSLRDWSSDVCSSDLGGGRPRRLPAARRAGRRRPLLWHPRRQPGRDAARRCPRSEERRVGKSVDLGGRRIIIKKKREIQHVGCIDSSLTLHTRTYLVF